MSETEEKALRIGVSTHDFLHLSGSIDLLRMIIRGLNHKNKHRLFLLLNPLPDNLKHQTSNYFIENIEKYFIIPYLLKRFFGKIEKTIRKSMVKNLLFSRDKSLKKIGDMLGQEIFNGIEILIYEGFRKGLEKTIKRYNIDVVIPTTFDLSVPFVSYVHDCQHKYFPENFQPSEIENREKLFKKLINASSSMIVTSQNTKNDIQRFYKGSPSKITVLPIATLLESNDFAERYDLLKKYKLPKKYFLISNQFRVHKSHETAIKALRIVVDANVIDCHIVFTGKMNDTRFPEYVNDFLHLVEKLTLSDHITFLGYIPKRDQLEIMKSANAVIQTTLFEGTPGGGAVYDAIALGVPAIVSDIPINYELPLSQNLVLFKVNNAIDLANKMQTFWHNPPKRSSLEGLIDQNNDRMAHFSDSLYSAIKKSIYPLPNINFKNIDIAPADQTNKPVPNKLKFNTDRNLSIQIPFTNYELTHSCFAFSLHKAGSSLLTKMLMQYCTLTNISFIDLPRMIEKNDLDIDQIEIDSVDQPIFESGYCLLGWRHFPPFLRHHNFSKSKNILLVRDPRDRLVSLYFSMLKSHYVPNKGYIRNILLASRKATEELTIDEFVISYIPEVITQWNRYHEFLDHRTTKIYRYEDVIYRKEEWLIDIVNYFEFPYDQKTIEKVSIENDIRPEAERPNEHIRQVKPGNYNLHLKKETIQKINRELGGYLMRYDYLTPENFGTQLVFAREGEETQEILKPCN